eukprot:535787_1
MENYLYDPRENTKEDGKPIETIVSYILSYWIRILKCNQYAQSVNEIIIFFVNSYSKYKGKSYHVKRNPVGGQYRDRCGRANELLHFKQFGNIFGRYSFHSRFLTKTIFNTHNIYIGWLCKSDDRFPCGYEGILILIQDSDENKLYGTFHSKSNPPEGTFYHSHGLYYLSAISFQTGYISLGLVQNRLHKLYKHYIKWENSQSIIKPQRFNYVIQRIKLDRNGERQNNVSTDKFMMDGVNGIYYLNSVESECFHIKYLILNHKTHFIAYMSDKNNRNDFILSICDGQKKKYGSMHTIDNNHGYYQQTYVLEIALIN